MEAENNNNETQKLTKPPLPPRDDVSSYQATAATTTSAEAYDAWENSKYFEEYAKLGIHCDMLRDKARMASYFNAINHHAADFKDKVVLDVGCGTGILSCWAAKIGGAKRVYSVEASGIAENAELIIARNNLSDRITVLHGKMEEVYIPEKVDIIISEWMGSFLLFESMLEAVLFARDYYLKPNGVILPASARVFLVPVNMDKLLNTKYKFLKEVQGCDMSALMIFARNELAAWVIRGQKVKPENVLAEQKQVFDINILTVTIEQLKKVISTFNFTIEKETVLHGFAAYFDVSFGETASTQGKAPITLSTAPDQPLTHWRQDLFLLKDDVKVGGANGQNVTGVVRFTQNQYWRRHYDVEVSFTVNGVEYYNKLGS
eukprot:TRINITY_DN23023_c0_g1_i1.p1 TRINITY_DN23023_c0_g1~~TRINITY_DN23023_c0_g1_i1.p1  ORF type:complete len:375 (-),score=84.60 TRINITY_DN23023_c0_g1_i1:80-1204(-)